MRLGIAGSVTKKGPILCCHDQLHIFRSALLSDL